MKTVSCQIFITGELNIKIELRNQKNYLVTISNRSIIQELSTLDKRTLSRDNPQSSWTLIFKLNYSVRLVKAREMTSYSKRGVRFYSQAS